MSSKIKVSKNNVKKVSQNDLRRLMNDHKKKIQTTTKKIEHPLAKYLEDDRIKCTLCNTIIRNEIVWKVHLNSRQHKDNAASEASKNSDSKKEEFLIPPIPDIASNNNVNKRSSEVLTNENLKPPKKLKGILKNAPSLPPGFFDDIKLNNTEIIESAETNISTSEQDPTDESVATNVEPMEVDANSLKIPEGFFDDPVLDAKARNLEYKDPIQEEWERFQKEIKEVNSVSNQIINNESEEATVDRQLIEFDEQLSNWNRVLNLEIKKEEVQSLSKVNRDIKKETSSDSEYDDEVLDEFLDWRSKNPLK